MKTQEKKNSGITLIALIITIIVLVILAGVSIASLNGNEGIFGKTKQAADVSNVASAKEKLQLILANYEIEKHINTDSNNLITYLADEKEKGKIDEVTDNSDRTITIKVDGYEFIVKTDDLSIENSDNDVGVIPQVTITINQTNGSPIVYGTNYEQVAITVKISNKEELTSVDSIELKNSSGEIIEKQKNIIGDSLADISYIVSQEGIYTVTVNGTAGTIQKQKVVIVRPSLRVGDYIDYIPDTASPYTSLTPENSGSTQETTSIAQENLKWQILKIYDDGSIDLIGNSTNTKIYFGDAIGYNNGVYFMNDICEKLYSKKSKGLIARSVKAEDIEGWLTDSGKGMISYYTSQGGVKVGETKTYPLKDLNYYPSLYAEENGSGIDTTETKTDGIGMSEKTAPGFTMPTTKTYDYRSNGSLTVTQTLWYIFNTMHMGCYGDGARALSTSKAYWVASRCIECDDYTVLFNLRYCGDHFGSTIIYNPRQGGCNNYLSLRPVVTLGPNVEITASETASNIEETPHQITKY